LTNDTEALVKSGTQIYAGARCKLNVEADQDVFDLSLSQAGTFAGDIGFSGTANWNTIDTRTIAQIEPGVTVAGGGKLLVTANDNIILVDFAGNVLKGEHVGFGFTLAGNTVQRVTLALVGDGTVPAGAGDPAGSYAVGSSTISAATTGLITAVSFAAADEVPKGYTPPQAND